MNNAETERVPLSTARKRLGDMVSAAAYGSKSTVITKNGANAAALVPVEEYDLLVELGKLVDLKKARLALKQAKEEGTISLEEAEKVLFG